MHDGYLVIIVSHGDGETGRGLRVQTVRCRTVSAAKAICGALNARDGILHAWWEED